MSLAASQGFLLFIGKKKCFKKVLTKLRKCAIMEVTMSLREAEADFKLIVLYWLCEGILVGAAVALGGE